MSERAIERPIGRWWGVTDAIRNAVLGLVELVAPPRCIGCELPAAPQARPFCPACAPLLERPSRALRPPAPAGAPFLYVGPMREALVRLKYAGRPDLAVPLGALLVQEAGVLAGQVDRVVPLPLHPRRLRERGYNQSALLARPLAAALGVPLDTRTLSRVRATPPQAALPRARRGLNMRGAFKALPCRARVLLVDDVRTTGASLQAAAEALASAGCRAVHSVALARAPG